MFWRFVVFLSIFFSVASSADVLLLLPNRGPRSGGSKVTVYGSGFNARTSICSFGSIPAACRIVSVSIAICISPGYFSAQSVAVEVSGENSNAHGVASVLFRYQGTHLVLILSSIWFKFLKY